MTTIRVGMAQVNPTVVDLDANAQLVKSFIRKAEELSVDLLAFPEMVITGYPPLELLPPKEIRSPMVQRTSRRSGFESPLEEEDRVADSRL